ncbi:MAG: ferric reductase-like transmembrane domain-containing protein [Gaiellaceae bacterium]
MIATASINGVSVAWLVARSAGLVAFALLAFSVSLGLAMSTRLLASRRTKMIMGWHQTLLWTTACMLVLHFSALLFDPVMPFGVGSVLVPGLSTWRPLTIAAGIVALWLVLALAVSFRLRKRIGQKRWRLLHYASFVAFALALGHALHAGTDMQRTGGLIFVGVVSAPVLWLSFARILMPRGAPRPAAKAPPPPARRVEDEAAPRAERVPAGVGA